jgi:hypothetical protein
MNGILKNFRAARAQNLLRKTLGYLKKIRAARAKKIAMDDK